MIPPHTIMVVFSVRGHRSRSRPTVGYHLFETMCPTAFLAPLCEDCFICTQPQNVFFLAKLALQGNRANGKKSLPGAVPGPKKRFKTVPTSGLFQKKSSAQWPKKSSKNWTGPCLSLKWSAQTGSASGKHLRKMHNLCLKVRT